MNRGSRTGFSVLLILVIMALLAGGGVLFSHYNNSPLSISEQTTQFVNTTNNIEVKNNDIATSTEITTITQTEIPDTIPPHTKNTNQIDHVSQIKPVVLGESTTKAEIVTEPTLVVIPGTQPTQTLPFGYSARVPFTVIELKAIGGDIDVESLTIQREGMGIDQIFTEVGVIDVDYERALNANHQYSTHDPFTIKEGETKEIVLFGNITDQTTLADYDGQTPTLALVAIETSAKISGTIPVVGTAHKVNSSLEIGSYEITGSVYDPGTDRSVQISDTNDIFSAVKATASGIEPIKLETFGFDQTGSISSSDITNIRICYFYKLNTKCYPADIDDRFYFTDFGGELTLDKGESADIYIEGDILPTATNRNIDFDINSSYNSYGTGTTYKNIMYSYGGEDNGNQPEGYFSIDATPFYNAYSQTVLGGTAVYIGR